MTRRKETIRDLEKIQDYLKSENATLSNRKGEYISQISGWISIERERIWKLGSILAKEGKIYRQIKLKSEFYPKVSYAVKDPKELSHGSWYHTKYYLNDLGLPPQKEVEEKLGLDISFQIDKFFEFLTQKRKEIINRLCDERGTLGPGGTKNWEKYINETLVEEIKGM